MTPGIQRRLTWLKVTKDDVPRVEILKRQNDLRPTECRCVVPFGPLPWWLQQAGRQGVMQVLNGSIVGKWLRGKQKSIFLEKFKVPKHIQWNTVWVSVATAGADQRLGDHNCSILWNKQTALTHRFWVWSQSLQKHCPQTHTTPTHFCETHTMVTAWGFCTVGGTVKADTGYWFKRASVHVSNVSRDLGQRKIWSSSDIDTADQYTIVFQLAGVNNLTAFWTVFLVTHVQLCPNWRITQNSVFGHRCAQMTRNTKVRVSQWVTMLCVIDQTYLHTPAHCGGCSWWAFLRVCLMISAAFSRTLGHKKNRKKVLQLSFAGKLGQSPVLHKT